MFDDVELTNAILEELSVVEMSATTSGGDLQIINPFSPEDIHTKYGTSMESIRSMIYNDERYTGLEAIITILSKELESHITSKMTIDDLSDVEITNLQNGDILQYNNGFWRNVEYTSGSGIPEIHDLISYHTVSGLTTGHFLKALSPTTFGFTSHGLTYSDVGAEPAFTKNTAFNKNFGSGHYDIPHGDHVHDYSTLTNIPTSFTPSAHDHAIADITNLQTTLDGKQSTISAGTTGQFYAWDKTMKAVDWAYVANKPTTFYTHPTGDGNLHVPATGTTNNKKVLTAGSTAGSLNWSFVDWADLLNKPSSFTPSAHSHAIADVTSLQTTLDGKQPLDSDLTAIAALTHSNRHVMVSNGSSWTRRALEEADLPSLSAAKITSGTLDNARLSFNPNYFVQGTNNRRMILSNSTNPLASTEYCTFFRMDNTDPSFDSRLTGGVGLGFKVINNSGPYSFELMGQASGNGVLLFGGADHDGVRYPWRSIWHSGNLNPADFSLTTHNHDALYAALSHNHSAAHITSGTLSVTRGGTGAGTLTGYVKGNGTSAFTASAKIPWADLSGIPSSFTPAAHSHTIADVTGLQTALDGKVPTSRTITAGTGLSGGGSLSANRTINVSFGSTAGTVCQGNDPRLSDARVPINNDYYVQGSNSSRTTEGSTDVNSYSKSGFYRATDGTPNLPTVDGCGIIHTNHTTGPHAFQLASRWYGNQLFYRTKSDGTWRPWVEIYHSGNFDPNDYALLSHNHTIADITGTRTTDAATTDVNSYSQSGFYRAHSSAPNLPSATGYGIIHTNYYTSNQHAFQLASRWYGNQLFYRTKSDGTWRPWVEIYHSGNFDPNDYALLSHNHSIADVTGLQTALDGKVPTSRTITAGTGLSGGGSLSANRTINVTFGSTAGTVCQGNDPRLSDARVPINNDYYVQGSSSFRTTDAGNTDVDSYTQSGFYRAISAAPHNPTVSGGYGIIHTNYISDQYAFQLASRWSANELYYRVENNGTWEPWVQLYHTGNLNPNDFAPSNHRHNMLYAPDNSAYISVLNGSVAIVGGPYGITLSTVENAPINLLASLNATQEINLSGPPILVPTSHAISTTPLVVTKPHYFLTGPSTVSTDMPLSTSGAKPGQIVIFTRGPGAYMSEWKINGKSFPYGTAKIFVFNSSQGEWVPVE